MTNNQTNSALFHMEKEQSIETTLFGTELVFFMSNSVNVVRAQMCDKFVFFVGHFLPFLQASHSVVVN